MKQVYKILVTGGKGFIGSNLVKRLKNLGHYVKVVDIKPNEDYCFDISQYQNFTQINEHFDIIYHLAAQSGGYRSLIEHELDLDWNAKGTLNVCMFAKSKKVKKIIYTSTMAVYGEGDWLKETDELKPLSNYGISKLYGETCLKQFSQFNIDYTIFRVFNTYGPGQNLTNGRQGVVAVFLSQLLKGSNIDVTGSLNRYRDLTYIDDNIDALILGLSDKTSKKIFNVCNQNKILIKDIIENLIKISNKPFNHFNITNIGKHDGDQFGNTGDNSKLKSIGWKPKVKLSKGLQLFYEYAKNII